MAFSPMNPRVQGISIELGTMTLCDYTNTIQEILRIFPSSSKPLIGYSEGTDSITARRTLREDDG